MFRSEGITFRKYMYIQNYHKQTQCFVWFIYINGKSFAQLIGIHTHTHTHTHIHIYISEPG